MEFRVLGPLDVVDDGGHSVEVRGRGLRTLLAVLVTRANETVTADVLIEAIWSSELPRHPASALQVLVSRLRKVIGSDALLTKGAGYVLRLSPDDVDVGLFDRLVGEADRAVSEGKPADAADRLRRGLSLWRGSALGDLSDVEPVRLECARWEEMRRRAEESLVEARLALGLHGDVLADLEALVGADPYREHRWGLKMLALYRSGRQAEALRTYRAAADLLGDELGIEPGPELRRLEERILLQDPDLEWKTPGRPPGGSPVSVVLVVVWFADEHRPAAELLGPGDVFRSDDSGLWAAYEDPASALAAAVGVAHLGSVGVHAGTVRATDRGYEGLEVNKAGRVAAAAMAGQVVVSSAAAALLGGVALPDLELAPLGEVPLPGVTEDEMLWTAVPSGESDRVSAGLVLRSRPGNLPGQLTTFVGRARELAEVVDLMRTNRLVTLTGPGGVGKTRLGLQAASDAMSRHRHGAWLVDLAEAQDPDLVPSTIAETLGLGVGQRDLLDELVTFLESRSVLLVVDNCEHVIDAVADTVHALLKGAPNLSVLATSRERLGIPGETPWTVPALELPDPETAPVEVLASSDAVSLFTERAAIVDSQVALTEAATRAVAELCRRLDGIPLAIELAAARSATLTPSEILHELTDRLDLLSTSDRAVHPRHRTLGAVIDWSYQHLADHERTLLRRLSVFQAPPTLEAIRAVCADGPLPAAAMVDHVEGLISKSMLARVPGTDPPRFRMLQTIRQYAHNQLAATGEEAAMHHAHATYYLDLVRRAGAHIEASDVAWLHAVRLDMDNLRNVITWSLDSGNPAVGFEIAAGIAPVWEVAGQVHEALAVAERLLSTTASVDPRLLANVAWVAGWAQWRMGHLDHARDRLEKALDVAVSSQDHRTEALIRMTLGNIAYDEGDKKAALDAYRRGIEPAERASDALLHSKLLMNVGIVHAWLGQHAEEEEYYRRALGLQRSTGHRREEAWTLLNLGDMLVQRGDRNATTLFSDALAIAETLGDRILEASALMELGSVAWRDEDLAQAREQLGTALRVFHEAGNTWNVLDIIWRFAGIAFTEGSHDSAALLIAAEAARRRELGLGPPDSSHDLTALADRIRAAMSAEDYESAQLRAEALRLDEVVALALAV